MVWGGGCEKRGKRGEKGVQVRQAVNDWFLCSLSRRSGVSCKTTGYQVKRRRFGLKLYPDWLCTTSTCPYFKEETF